MSCIIHAVWTRSARRILNTAIMPVLRSRDDSEDVLQDVFERALRSELEGKLEGVEYPDSWVWWRARYGALQALREIKRRYVSTYVEEKLTAKPQQSMDVWLRSKLDSTLSQLEPLQVQLLQARDEGHTHQQLGELFGMSAQQTGKSLRTARDAFIRQWENEHGEGQISCAIAELFYSEALS